MHPRISVHGISARRWTLDQDLELFSSMGFSAMTLPFAILGPDLDSAARKVEAAGMQQCLLGGGAKTPLIGGMAALRAPIEAAAKLGCRTFYSVSGAVPDGLSNDEAFEVLVDVTGAASDAAAAKGVRLAVENTSQATRAHGFLHTLQDVVDLSRSADVDIVVELQNCWYERHLTKLFRSNVSRFAIVQVSDFRIGEELRLNRRVPGDGSIPLVWLISELLGAGYDGLFDIEILGPSIEQEGYESAIRRSADRLSEILVRLGA